MDRLTSALSLVIAASLLTACPGPVEEGTVSGVVTYDFVPTTYDPSTHRGTLAFSQSEERPVRNVVVQVRRGSDILGESVTDDEGRFSVTFSAHEGEQVMLVALAKTVNPQIQVEDNTDNEAIWAVGANITTDTANQDLYATHGWNDGSYDAERRIAAPFAVLDSMYTAAHAFLAVRDVQFPPLRVNWSPENVPEGGAKEDGYIGTSHFAFVDKEIYILGKDGIDTDEFDSHVVVHEWGHYFERTLSRSDSIGGPHQTGDLLDPRVAFGEGYGNALSAMLLPSSTYVDTWWLDGRELVAFGFNLETEPNATDDPNPGPFSEMSVGRFLYDVFDAGAGEAHDGTAYGLGTIHDVLVGPQRSTAALTTIASFVTGLKLQGGVDASAVDALLAHYNVGPIVDAWGLGDDVLAGMFWPVSAYPHFDTYAFTGGPGSHNKVQQNHYFVVPGTGGVLTVEASSSWDVGLRAYGPQGEVAEDDDTVRGTESVSFETRADVDYVVTVTGFEEDPIDYSYTLSITE